MLTSIDYLPSDRKVSFLRIKKCASDAPKTVTDVRNNKFGLSANGARNLGELTTIDARFINITPPTVMVLNRPAR